MIPGLDNVDPDAALEGSEAASWDSDLLTGVAKEETAAAAAAAEEDVGWCVPECSNPDPGCKVDVAEAT